MRRLILAGCAVLIAGCSSTGGVAGSGGTSAGGTTGNGGAGANSAGGTGGGVIVVDGGGGSSGSTGLDAGCATAKAAASLVPAVMEFVIDTSGSMGDPAPGGGTKWSVTQTALGSAFDNMGAGDAVGLFFFPGTDPSISGGTCIIKQQAVPIAALGATGSSQRTAISQALQTATPLGGTPTFDAYMFALNTLTASTLPGNKFIVLITDGAPTYSLYCQGDGQTPVPNGPLISQVAYASAYDGVRTFVIGSPGSESARTDLSKMASAGGTPLPGCSDSGPNYCHFDMTTQPNLAQALNDALAKISGAALSCTYDVPSPPNGQTLDPSKVNVVFTPSSGPATDIYQNKGTCTDGWQYSADGKQIIICGPACDKVKNDPGGKISIVFGCSTKVH